MKKFLRLSRFGVGLEPRVVQREVSKALGHWLAHETDYEKQDIHRIVLGFIELGANLRVRTYEEGGDLENITILMRAMDSSDPQLIKTILRREPSLLDAVDSEFHTALMWASVRGNIHAVNALINLGADIHESDNYHKTALMFAAQKNRPHVAKALLDAGASVRDKDSSGMTALTWAVKYIGMGGPEVVQVLIDHNADINHQDNDGNTPLLCAIGNGYLESGRALLRAGAKVDIQAKDGRTALSIAKQWGDDYGPDRKEFFFELEQGLANL